jgi:hypothetical protein
MTAEMKDEAMDICITAVEKYQKEMEKCTQVGNLHMCNLRTPLHWEAILGLVHH